MWLNIQIFGFRALWSPYFFLFVLSLAVVYFLMTGPYRHKFGGAEKPTTKQQLWFYIGLLLLYIVKGSPIDLLTHIMLTFHMIQMAIFYIVFPICIIKGLPAWIWEKVFANKIVRPGLKLLTKPLISLFLFNSLFSIYHLPVIFDFSKSSQGVHTSISIIILIAAFIVWLPVLAPIKELEGLSPLLKIGYIFANGVLITPACVLIIFATNTLFAAYSQDGAWMQAMALCVPGDILQGISPGISGPEMFSSMSTMEDQQLGGIIMKLMQEIVYGIVLARVFFGWFSRESLRIDPIPVNNNIPETH